MFRLKPPCPKENWARLARVDGLSMDRRWKMLSVAGSQTVVPDADAWWCLDIVLNKTIGKEVCRCTICTHLIYYIYNIHLHLHIHLYIHITYPTNQSYEILHIIYSLYTAVRSIERERDSQRHDMNRYFAIVVSENCRGILVALSPGCGFWWHVACGTCWPQ